MSAPLCRNCGKPLRKKTTSFYLREPQEGRPQGFRQTSAGNFGAPVPEMAVEAKPEGHRDEGYFSWTIFTANRPKTKAECARFTNYPITSVSRDHMGTIGSFTAWDGESYERNYRWFCKNDCAAQFGRAMADRGARL